jgi:hypothetical protein
VRLVFLSLPPLLQLTFSFSQFFRRFSFFSPHPQVLSFFLSIISVLAPLLRLSDHSPSLGASYSDEVKRGRQALLYLASSQRSLRSVRPSCHLDRSLVAVCQRRFPCSLLFLSLLDLLSLDPWTSRRLSSLPPLSLLRLFFPRPPLPPLRWATSRRRRQLLLLSTHLWNVPPHRPRHSILRRRTAKAYVEWGSRQAEDSLVRRYPLLEPVFVILTLSSRFRRSSPTFYVPTRSLFRQSSQRRPSLSSSRFHRQG